MADLELFKQYLGLADLLISQSSKEDVAETARIKVIARGFRWQRLLYDGTYATIEDLAAAEKINPSYVSRILRLAYLSPTVVQAILEGSHPAWLTMKDLLEPFPMDWKQQEKKLLAQFRLDASRAASSAV